MSSNKKNDNYKGYLSFVGGRTKGNVQNFKCLLRVFRCIPALISGNLPSEGQKSGGEMA